MISLSRRSAHTFPSNRLIFILSSAADLSRLEWGSGPQIERLGETMIKHSITRHLSAAALVATGVLALAGVVRPEATTVATIQGAYDKDVYDTPELDFFNTSGGSLINAKMHGTPMKARLTLSAIRFVSSTRLFARLSATSR